VARIANSRMVCQRGRVWAESPSRIETATQRLFWQSLHHKK
jgi:hypothetical protein